MIELPTVFGGLVGSYKYIMRLYYLEDFTLMIIPFHIKIIFTVITVIHYKDMHIPFSHIIDFFSFFRNLFKLQ